jgi:hypothetical protein
MIEIRQQKQFYNSKQVLKNVLQNCLNTKFYANLELHSKFA